MQRVLFYLFTVLFSCHPFVIGNGKTPSSLEATSSCRQLYTNMQLDDIVNYTAFEQAMEGYDRIGGIKKDTVTLIDYSRPSTEKRFYVFDLKQKKLLYSTFVSHGRNSGGNYATSFSNQNGSYQSSLGFFRTENTYEGKNGLSLVLNGLENGINDHAKVRAIVIHGASYCNPSLIVSNGRLGRSQGCPALPEAVHKLIIHTIKGGTLLYIYANDKNYLNQSFLFN